MSEPNKTSDRSDDDLVTQRPDDLLAMLMEGPVQDDSTRAEFKLPEQPAVAPEKQEHLPEEKPPEQQEDKKPTAEERKSPIEEKKEPPKKPTSRREKRPVKKQAEPTTPRRRRKEVKGDQGSRKEKAQSKANNRTATPTPRRRSSGPRPRVRAKDKEEGVTTGKSRRRSSKDDEHGITTGKSKSSGSSTRSSRRHRSSESAKTADGQLNKATVAQFNQWFPAVVKKGVNGLKEEYSSSIRSYLPVDYHTVQFMANPKKNRFKDVFCIDETRVKLNKETNDEGDYIHASFVQGLRTHYICTQGPKEDTVVDFWRMIWQENVALVIMLCDIEEQGKRKCALYWPRSEQSSFGNFTIVMEQKETVPLADAQSVVLHKLKVTNSRAEGEEREIEHYQWTGWPDKSVPSSAAVPLHLVKRMDMFPGRPVVVHCSAGIGRTGTLVALHMCLSKLLQRERLNVMEMVKKLRDQRVQSIQTDLQYVFVHRAIFEFFSTNNVNLINEDFMKFIVDYQRITAPRQ